MVAWALPSSPAAVPDAVLAVRYATADNFLGVAVYERAEPRLQREAAMAQVRELRENGGELEAARAGTLPALVTERDLRGDLHAHTDWSDGRLPLERMIEAAQARGHEYVIVSDHSKASAIARGLSVDALRAQIARIRELQPRFRIRILAGSECDNGHATLVIQLEDETLLTPE